MEDTDTPLLDYILRYEPEFISYVLKRQRLKESEMITPKDGLTPDERLAADRLTFGTGSDE